MFVKASVGIATGHRASADELLRDADIAMYRAKWGGKNRYVIFESGMEDAVQCGWSSRWTCRGARERRVLPRLPADLRPRDDGADRRRGADPLAAPGPRRRRSPTTSSRCWRSPARSSTVGAWVLRGGLRAGRGWHAAGHRVGDRGQRLGAVSSTPTTCSATSRRRSRERPRPDGADDRDHRDDADAQRRGDRARGCSR